MINNVSKLAKNFVGIVKKQGLPFIGPIKHSIPERITGLKYCRELCTDTIELSAKSQHIINEAKTLDTAYTPYTAAKKAMEQADNIMNLLKEAYKIKDKSGIVEIAGSKFRVSMSPNGTKFLTKIQGNIGVKGITITPAKGKPTISIQSDCCSIINDSFYFSLKDQMGNEFIREAIFNPKAIATKPLKSYTDILKDKDGKLLVVHECNRGNYIYDFTTQKYETDVFFDSNQVTKRYQAEIVDNIESIGYSQQSVQSQSYNDLVNYMRKDGWSRGPIHIIEMNKKRYSMDNRRLSAAKTTNTKPHIIVHCHDEILDEAQRARFRIVDNTTNTEIHKPETWGEAIFNRLFCNGLVKDGELVFTTQQPSTFPDEMLQRRTETLAKIYQQALKEDKLGDIPYQRWLAEHL